MKNTIENTIENTSAMQNITENTQKTFCDVKNEKLQRISHQKPKTSKRIKLYNFDTNHAP